MLPACDINLVEEFDPRTFGATKQRGAKRTRLICVSVAVIAMALGAILLLSGAPVLEGLTWFAAIVSPLCLVACFIEWEACVNSEIRTNSIQQGVLSVQSGDTFQEANLAECSWFEGQYQDDAKLPYWLKKRECLVIVFPSGQQHACAFDETSRENWRTCLASQSRKVRRRAGLFGTLVVLAMATLLPASAYLAYTVGGWLLSQADGGGVLLRSVVAFAGILFVAICCIAPNLTPGWRRYTTSERDSFRRWATVFPTKAGLGVAWCATGSAIATVAVYAGLVATLWLSCSKLFPGPISCSATSQAYHPPS